MNRLIQTGIVSVAGVVAVGALGIGVATASQSTDRDQAVKREDTASSWTVPAADHDDDHGDPGANLQVNDSPTQHSTLTANSVNTSHSANTANTANTANSVNTANSKNSASTSHSADSSHSNAKG